jgi:hypothetical protein
MEDVDQSQADDTDGGGGSGDDPTARDPAGLIPGL